MDWQAITNDVFQQVFGGMGNGLQAQPPAPVVTGPNGLMPGYAGSGLIAGQRDDNVADDTMIKAKKGEYVLSTEVVDALGGPQVLDNMVMGIKKSMGLPAEVGPSYNGIDAQGRQDAPGMPRGIGGFADSGATTEERLFPEYKTRPEEIANTSTLTGGIKGLVGAGVGAGMNFANDALMKVGSKMTTPEKAAASSKGQAVPLNIVEAFTPPKPQQAAAQVPITPLAVGKPVAAQPSAGQMTPNEAGKLASQQAKRVFDIVHKPAAVTAAPAQAQTTPPAKQKGMHFVVSADDGAQISGNQPYKTQRYNFSNNEAAQLQVGKDRGGNYRLDKNDWSDGSFNQRRAEIDAKYNQEVARAKEFNSIQNQLSRLANDMAYQAGNNYNGKEKIAGIRAQMAALTNQQNEENKIKGIQIDADAHNYAADRGLEGHKATADATKYAAEQGLEGKKAIAESRSGTKLGKLSDVDKERVRVIDAQIESLRNAKGVARYDTNIKAQNKQQLAKLEAERNGLLAKAEGKESSPAQDTTSKIKERIAAARAAGIPEATIKAQLEAIGHGHLLKG